MLQLKNIDDKNTEILDKIEAKKVHKLPINDKKKAPIKDREKDRGTSRISYSKLIFDKKFLVKDTKSP